MDDRIFSNDFFPMPNIKTGSKIQIVWVFVFEGVFLEMILVLK